MPIGDFIKRERLSHGGKGYWSRLSVARKAGISDSYLFQLEENQNNRPSPGILKKLAPVLQVGYDELMHMAGYSEAPKEKTTHTVAVPVYGEYAGDNFAFSPLKAASSLEIDFELLKDRACFGLRVKGDCLHDCRISDGEILIVSPHADIANGDIVLAGTGDKCALRRFYLADDNAILKPCDPAAAPAVLKRKNAQIIGRVILSIKSF